MISPSTSSGKKQNKTKNPQKSFCSSGSYKTQSGKVNLGNTCNFPKEFCKEFYIYKITEP